jgi:hypothetical protein
VAKRSTVRRAARTGRNYNFTYKRKAALYRAAKISAEKRRKNRIKKVAITGVAIAGVGAGAYLGHRYGPQAVAGVRNFKPQLAEARNKIGMRIAVDPHVRENIRVNGSIVVANPSKTVITEADRAAAKKLQAEAERTGAPNYVQRTFRTEVGGEIHVHDQMVNIGGEDQRIYNEDNSVNTQAMVDRSVARTRTNAARREIQGRRTASLTGTPGGTQTPPQAQRSHESDIGPISEAYWASILGATPQGAAGVGVKGGPVKPLTSTSGGTNVASHTTSSDPNAGRKKNEAAVVAQLKAEGAQIDAMKASAAPKTWKDVLGKQIPGWEQKSMQERKRIHVKGYGAGYYVSQTGKVSRKGNNPMRAHLFMDATEISDEAAKKILKRAGQG